MRSFKKNICAVVVTAVSFVPVAQCPPELPVKLRKTAAVSVFKTCKLPDPAPLAEERTNPEAVGERFRSAGPLRKRRLARFKESTVKVFSAENDHLRSFLVRPSLEGNRFESAAALILSAAAALGDKNPLSVAAYAAAEREAQSLLGGLMENNEFHLSMRTDSSLVELVQSWHRLDLLRKAQELAQRILDLLPTTSKHFEPDPTNPGAFVFILKEWGIVLKIPNPYTSYHHHYNRRLAGFGGESTSLKRQVRRVSYAARIAEECAGLGIKVPKKYLCLRPGASYAGPINDKHCFVIAALEEQGPSLVDWQANITDNHVEGLRRAATITRSIDFHEGNVWPDARTGELRLIDTERTCAFVPDSILREQPTGVMNPFMDSPALAKEHLQWLVKPAELPRYLDARVVWLTKLLPAGEPIEVFRSWFSSYLDALVERGDITDRQRNVIARFWLSSDSLWDGLPAGTPFEVRARALRVTNPGFDDGYLEDEGEMLSVKLGAL